MQSDGVHFCPQKPATAAQQEMRGEGMHGAGTHFVKFHFHASQKGLGHFLFKGALCPLLFLILVIILMFIYLRATALFIAAITVLPTKQHTQHMSIIQHPRIARVPLPNDQRVRTLLIGTKPITKSHPMTSQTS